MFVATRSGLMYRNTSMMLIRRLQCFGRDFLCCPFFYLLCCRYCSPYLPCNNTAFVTQLLEVCRTQLHHTDHERSHVLPDLWCNRSPTIVIITATDTSESATPPPPRQDPGKPFLRTSGIPTDLEAKKAPRWTPAAVPARRSCQRLR
jgi:hypothetical protein